MCTDRAKKIKFGLPTGTEEDVVVTVCTGITDCTGGVAVAMSCCPDDVWTIWMKPAI